MNKSPLEEDDDSMLLNSGGAINALMTASLVNEGLRSAPRDGTVTSNIAYHKMGTIGINPMTMSHGTSSSGGNHMLIMRSDELDDGSNRMADFPPEVRYLSFPFSLFQNIAVTPYDQHTDQEDEEIDQH